MAASLVAASLLLFRSGGLVAEAGPVEQRASCAGGDACAAGRQVAGGLASDHVLLQSVHSRRVSSTAAGQEEPPVVQQCHSCLAAVDSVDGCASMLDETFIFNHELADFDSECGHCSSEVLAHCFPLLQSGTCDACVEAFDSAGGCKVMEDIMGELENDPGANVTGLQDRVVELIPLGCQPCGEDAARHCTAMPAAPDDHEVSDPGASPGNCKTAVPGDQCFLNIRWAMQVGVSTHPEWYNGLTRASSFENFQQHLHLAPRHSCPQPCPAAETGEDCHTAAPGEDCHQHVAWAREVGISTVPQWYPADLTRSSSLEQFQAWLHQIHHGSCPRPCAVA